MFYSDGLTEARDATGAFFGTERLIEVIKTHDDDDPTVLVHTIRRAVLTFLGAEACTDDLTCVAVVLEKTSPEPTLAHAQCETTSETNQLAVIRSFVHEFCHASPGAVMDEEHLHQLELAVTEAASNIMRHAYHGRGDQRIRVTTDAFFDRIVIRLSHRGTGFDPKTVVPPTFDGSREGGFGVYIIAHTVDEVRYGRDESGEHSICLVKKRKTLEEEA
ncbi:MAG: ATP-binding protein [Candidatus Binatia bacterium]